MSRHGVAADHDEPDPVLIEQRQEILEVSGQRLHQAIVASSDVQDRNGGGKQDRHLGARMPPP